ncbi:hypothetical protein [Thalassococcus sp. S3]|uniref:hypothetical protein n=1 Tax=Thalassococcus sp. S3 TaxID=2017482 RepID=UPI00102C0D5F|nr:hypothetical protein [Thalassococcus sp. S3]
MIVTLVLCVAAIGLGFAIAKPTARRGVGIFLGAVSLLFAGSFGINAARGFEGLPLEESLLLFEGSLTAYLVFNAQLAYRDFALPLLLLASVTLLQMRRVKV